MKKKKNPIETTKDRLIKKVKMRGRERESIEYTEQLVRIFKKDLSTYMNNKGLIVCIKRWKGTLIWNWGPGVGEDAKSSVPGKGISYLHFFELYALGTQYC